MSEQPRTVDDIDDAFVPRPRAGVAGEELDGEMVLIDEASGVLHALNETATIVWTSFDGLGSIADIVADLVELCSTDGATDGDLLRADVLRLTRELGDLGLLEGVTPRPDEPGGDR